ncbi:MAG: hypothetical protein AAF721_12790 [Myxococcota bacterium]
MAARSTRRVAAPHDGLRPLAAALLIAGCSTELPAPSEPSRASAESGEDDGGASSSDDGVAACGPEGVASVYDRRIAPLLADDRPSTCNECHLKGIDLSMYVQGDACQTMACLVDEGLVDLERPDDSIVLSWVARAEPQGLITQATIDEEYAGMREWIATTASCGDAACPKYDNPCGAPPELDDCELTYPDAAGEFEDPGGCSDLEIEQLWRNTVYAWRGRCYPCHFEGEVEPEDSYAGPPWIVLGDCDEASLQSLRRAEAGGYFDVDDPPSSLMLLKPLEEALGGVQHGGDDKIHSREEGVFLDLMLFAERYSECFGDE